MTEPAVGPVLPAGHRPWPRDWHANHLIDETHTHAWETVLVPACDRWILHEVVRCALCLAPRCGQTRDPNPCTRRLLHTAPHESAAGDRWIGPPTPRIPVTRWPPATETRQETT